MEITYKILDTDFTLIDSYAGWNSNYICKTCKSKLVRLDGEAWLDNIGACMKCETIQMESYMYDQESSTKTRIQTKIYRKNR